ncbi:MAG TPA: glycosyltransferase family 2 protein [Gemmatimonadales bacterium]|nr:glycosyltransferase family 2 protein [Gemmatimonadales bacterium]
MSTSSLPPGTQPHVSVILPCRNEARYIAACLDSILATAYPKDRLEILVVDGMSSDGTRRIVQDLAAHNPEIRLLDNPQRIVPTALNTAITASQGDIIVRMDAHVIYPPEYLPRLVQGLSEGDVDNVGGCMITLPADGTAMAQAIAIAMAHPFAVGNAHFRLGAREARYVDTVPFGCYRREIFEKVGYFDEDLVRNQDDEFNARILTRGGRIRLLPDVLCYYYARGSIPQLSRMFYQYGAFKPLVARKVGRVMTLRQLVPAGFVSALGAALIGGLFWRPAWYIGLGLAALYALGVLGSVGRVVRSHGVRCAAALAVVFPVVHFSYGFGFLRGLRGALLGRRGLWRDPTAIPLSR